MIYIILIAIYLLSTYGMWKYIQVLFSKGGRLGGGVISGAWIAFMLMPVINTISNSAWIFDYPKKGHEICFNSLFNIKK